jgi:DDE superfamily endonuclease
LYGFFEVSRTFKTRRAALHHPHQSAFAKLFNSGQDDALVTLWGFDHQTFASLKLQLERAGDKTTQNNFYNGWTHNHYVSNLFLFSPDGKIRACYINAPGTFHNSTMANMSKIDDLIDDIYAKMGSKIVVDSAFAADNRKSVYKSHQNNIDQHGRVRQHSSIHKQATALRQLAEWGMRDLQGSFPPLKDRLLYEERGEQWIILEMIVLLYNFPASTVGMNQIQSNFMSHLERSANKVVFNF